MLSDLGSLALQKGSFQSGLLSIESLAEKKLLPLLGAAFLLLVLIPSRLVALVWVLCAAALFTIGVIGRPGVLRVYIPVLSLLLVAPLIVEFVKLGYKKHALILVMLVACGINIYLVTSTVRSTSQWTQQVQQSLRTFPNKPIVIWGAGYGISTNPGFPFVFAYPVLATNLGSLNFQLYTLNTFTLAPYSVATSMQKAGQGMLENLQSKMGIQIMAGSKKIEALGNYCKENLNGRLLELVTKQTALPIKVLRCEADR